MVVFYFGSEGLSVGSNFWLARWSEVTNSTPEVRDLYLGVYGAFGASKAVTSLLTSVIGALAVLNGSRLLHRRMLERVLHAPMSFFDTTPLGRIVNRFSKDINIIDEILPRTFNFFLIMLSLVTSTLVVISVSTPIFMVVIIPLMVLYIFTQVQYIFRFILIYFNYVIVLIYTRYCCIKIHFYRYLSDYRDFMWQRLVS